MCIILAVELFLKSLTKRLIFLEKYLETKQQKASKSNKKLWKDFS